MRRLRKLTAIMATVLLSVTMLAGCFTFSVITANASTDAEMYLYNPYRDVDWDTFTQHRAQVHLHSRGSDGGQYTDELAVRYNRLGYDFLFLTDHYTVTYPWGGPYIGGAPGGGNNHLTGQTRPQFDELEDAIKNSFLTAPASELNNNQHHIGQHFSDYRVVADSHGELQPGGSKIKGEFDLMREATAYNNGSGRFIMNHPGRRVADYGSRNYAVYDAAMKDKDFWYNADFYKKMYNDFPTVVGMEVYNKNDTENQYNRLIYEYVLTETMAQRPQRPFWMIGADDNHSRNDINSSSRTNQGQFGWNHITPILPAWEIDEYKYAFERGTFFSSSFYIRESLDGRDKSSVFSEGALATPEMQDARSDQPVDSTYIEPGEIMNTYGPYGGRYRYMPRIQKIEVKDNGDITIMHDIADMTKFSNVRISWMSGDGGTFGTRNVVGTEDTFNWKNELAKPGTKLKDYVRAVIIYEDTSNPNEIIRIATHTQPFGIAPYDEESWYFNFDRAEKREGGIVNAPKFARRSETSVTILASAAPSGQAVEYGISRTNSVESVTAWQRELVFTGLEKGTTYYIFARSVENNMFNVGIPSNSLQVATSGEVEKQQEAKGCQSSFVSPSLWLFSLIGVLLGALLFFKRRMNSL